MSTVVAQGKIIIKWDIDFILLRYTYNLYSLILGGTELNTVDHKSIIRRTIDIHIVPRPLFVTKLHRHNTLPQEISFNLF
jgi:hypothetical protein